LPALNKKIGDANYLRAVAVCEELDTKMQKSGLTTQRSNKANLSNLKISACSKKLNK